MSSLLKEDYNAKYSKEFYRHLKKIRVPKGKLGLHLEYTDEGLIIGDYSPDCKIKNLINIGDEVVRLNGVNLKDMSLDEAQLLFLNKQNCKRVIHIFRQY
jgi:C-terminal processing protease CtpA/Prc